LKNFFFLEATGGGTENLSFYKNVSLEFLDIENIHVMREAQKKLFSLCNLGSEDAKWLSSLEATHWFLKINRKIF
jgi:hypothetical protein